MFLKSPLMPVVFIALWFSMGAPSQIAAAAPSEQALQRQTFTVDGRPAFIIAPTKKLSGPTPWLLYAPTLGSGLPGGAEAWMFRQFLDAGIAIAEVDGVHLCGSLGEVLNFLVGKVEDSARQNHNGRQYQRFRRSAHHDSRILRGNTRPSEKADKPESEPEEYAELS